MATLFFIEQSEGHIHAKQEVRSIGRASPAILVIRIKEIIDAQEYTHIRDRLIAQIKIRCKVSGTGRSAERIQTCTHRTSKERRAQLSLAVG